MQQSAAETAAIERYNRVPQLKDCQKFIL